MEQRKAAAAQKIYSRVLGDIRPSKLEVESTIANANRTMARLKKIVPKGVTLVVAGSIARSTNLKGDHDIDIFMLFDKKVSHKNLEKMGIEYAKRMVDKKSGERFELKYAQHPYARLHLDKIDMKIDVVPAYKIDNIEELATAVDRTPLHTKFINKHFTDKMRDDVRLLKYLLKGHGIYGAEVKVQGFSGYLCELLIYNFGSFNNLLESAVNFKMPLCISPKDKAAKADKQTFEKFGSDFVVIDPVDSNRNVAAGVSKESLARFAFIANKFLQNPDIKIFYGEGFSSSQISKRIESIVKSSGLDLYLMVISVPDKSEDIVWPQLRKASEIIDTQIKKFGFRTYLGHVWIERKKGFIAYLAPRESLPTRVFQGPSVFYGTKSVEGFLNSHKHALAITVEQDRINAIDSNKYPTIGALLKDVASGKVIGKRKDISFKGGKLFVNKIPREYAETAYFEIHGKMRV
ncbi:MAG: CCA tRNA nucleotidyltransferase [Candidatus Micrarchaeota archaeon]|nr:CCA tRNA nucleotidyltransferase [Candidatus Micrarchaeota archaeon]